LLVFGVASFEILSWLVTEVDSFKKNCKIPKKKKARPNNEGDSYKDLAFYL